LGAEEGGGDDEDESGEDSTIVVAMLLMPSSKMILRYFCRELIFKRGVCVVSHVERADCFSPLMLFSSLAHGGW
jgi:hypothetical protein